MNILKIIFTYILNGVFPQKPHVAHLEALAEKQRLRELTSSSPTPKNFMRALFTYKDQKVRTLIWQIKYAGNKTLTVAAAQLLSEEIISYVEEHGSFVSKDWLLIPIPGSKHHLKKKGFNQTHRICEAIMETTAKDFVIYVPSGLQKTRETEAQVSIKNRSKRMKNLKNTYETSQNELVQGKNVFVVDDVITTGSTMTEARRALKADGARQIICLAIAH